MISRDTDLTKQESSTSTADSSQHKNFNTINGGASTSSWSRLRDPRIVRVSRAFGGKDRHSKVCTVRGLRDRRVRLSVPTAIQLYDLQDRLGLNQPSKVVDWLLNAAKHEIDELPPLQFPQGGFLSMMNPSQPGGIITGKSKDVPSPGDQRDDDCAYVRAQQNPASLMASLMNGTSPSSSIPSFVRWDPSNLSLAQSLPSRSPESSPQDWHNFSLAYQPYFHSQISAPNSEFDAKNITFQSSLHPSQNNDGS